MPTTNAALPDACAVSAALIPALPEAKAAVPTTNAALPLDKAVLPTTNAALPDACAVTAVLIPALPLI